MRRRLPLKWVRAGALALLAAAAWGLGARRGMAGNALMVIQPYRFAGTWVFDDPSRGLLREPFVAGVPAMIDALVADIPDAEHGFRLLFSAAPFPGATHTLVWRHGDASGNWYWCETLQQEGWLCPGLFRYYPRAPREIHVRAEPR